MTELALNLDNASEDRSLEELESIIEHGLDTFVEVGQALLEIRDGRKYRDRQFMTFEDYCKERWGMGRNYANKLIASAEVVRVIEPLGTTVPTSQRQARELAPLLGEPTTLAEAWTEAQERATAAARTVTAADVREVVQRRTGPGVYSSGSDLWSTPQALFDELNSEFKFTLDVCATPENAKCDDYFTEADDGLTQSWRGVCWMNPPYGDEIVKWVRKAYEASLLGTVVVCLVPARVDTGWWWDYCIQGQVRFLRGRLKFGGGANSAPFPSAVIVFPAKPEVVWWAR